MMGEEMIGDGKVTEGEQQQAKANNDILIFIRASKQSPPLGASSRLQVCQVLQDQDSFSA
jgi:glutaredoxin-related protein